MHDTDNLDQAFLNAKVQEAAKSGDENAVKRVFLDYQKAMLTTLQQFEPCEQCSGIDFTLMKRRVAKLMTTTENYLATVEVLPQSQVQRLFAESRTLFRDVAQLCDACRATIRQAILINFKQLGNRGAAREE